MNPPQTPRRSVGPQAAVPPEPAGKVRDERLKAALKANLARRKAQRRARAPDKAQCDADAGAQPSAAVDGAGVHDIDPKGAPDHG